MRISRSSGDLTRLTNLPQDPSVGFTMMGYVSFSATALAASRPKTRKDRGVGTPDYLSFR